MPQLYANNAYGSLGGSISNSATSVTLAAGHGARFPSPAGGDYFLATLVGLDSNANENAWEIVKVTARSGDTLTVVRAQESTTAVAWPAGARIEARGTAGTFDNLLAKSGGTVSGQVKIDGYASASFPVNGGTTSGQVTHIVSPATTYTNNDGSLSGALFGHVSQPTISNSGANGVSPNTVWGGMFVPQIVSSGSSAYINAYGIQGFAERSNAADVSSYASNSLFGAHFTARHTSALVDTASSGSITAVAGSAIVQSGVATAVAGMSSIGSVGSSSAVNKSVTVSNYYQFLGNAVNVGSAANSYGTITNYYGMYLAAPNVAARGTITNRYGVYQADASATNYFAGPVTFASDGQEYPSIASTADGKGSALVGFKQAGAGAVSRNVQDRLREVVSVIDFGADPTGVTDSTAAFTYAAAASGSVSVPAGTYLLSSAPVFGNSVFKVDKGVSATGAFGATSVFANATTGFIQPNSAANEFAVLQVRRQAQHSGGTAGCVSSGIRADTYVGSANTNFEWSIIGRVYNQATAGENVGIYGQGVKASTGPTWGMVAEGRDETNTNNPTSGLLGIEVDIFANGTDNNNNRIGVDIVAGQAITGVGHSACAAYAGIRVGGRNVAGDVGSFSNGLVVTSATYSGILLSNTGTFGVLFSPGSNLQIGADFSSATFSLSAMRFARQQNIALEASGTIKLQTLGATDSRLRFINTATEVFGINVENVNSSSRLVISGTCASGVDLAGGTYTNQAIVVPRGKGISFENTNTITQFLDAATNVLRLNYSGTEKIGFIVSDFDANNGVRINGTAVIGPRKTGWVGPSGTANRTVFDTASVTTQQLAERFKALIEDLFSHGLIGA